MKNPASRLGKISFFASLAACVLFAIFLAYLYFFYGHNARGRELDVPPIIGETWVLICVVTFLFQCFFYPPIFSIVALVCGIIGIRRNGEMHKRLALIGSLTSITILALYSLYFIPLLFL